MQPMSAVARPTAHPALSLVDRLVEQADSAATAPACGALAESHRTVLQLQRLLDAEGLHEGLPARCLDQVERSLDLLLRARRPDITPDRARSWLRVDASRLRRVLGDRLAQPA